MGKQVIVRLLEMERHAAASCPHCGCSGKNIQRFILRDGTVAGAMSGCLRNAFYIVPEALELRTWERRLEKHPGWKLAESETLRLVATINRKYQCDIEVVG